MESTKSKDVEGIRHKIGDAFTRQGAILVTEYLRDRFSIPQSKYPRESFCYKEDYDLRGDLKGYPIIVLTDTWELDDSGIMVEVCRAFLVGMRDGDHVWA